MRDVNFHSLLEYWAAAQSLLSTPLAIFIRTKRISSNSIQYAIAYAQLMFMEVE